MAEFDTKHEHIQLEKIAEASTTAQRREGLKAVAMPA